MSLYRIETNNRGCWLWLGPTDAYGRPLTFVKGRAKRLAQDYFEKKYGRRPTRIRLSCGHANCLNPEHMIEERKTSSNTSRTILHLQAAIAGAGLDEEEKDELRKELASLESKRQQTASKPD